MSTAQALDQIRQRVLAGHVLLLLQTYEEQRWTDALAQLASEMEWGLVTWTSASGVEPMLSSGNARDPLEFLNIATDYPEEHFFLLKDLHPYLTRPEVVRKLRDLTPVLRERRQAILMTSPLDTVPVELAKEVSILTLPLPGLAELREVLTETLQAVSPEAQVEERQTEHLIKAVLGLTAEEARRAYAQVLRDRETIDEHAYAALVHEKRHMVQGSDLLEFFDLDAGLEDIGGLEGLKEWIRQRAEAFSEDARSRGISYPKGVLLTGVQGCGKSLSAKAIARLLGFPLVRLDIANLLESQRGSSEQNLRDVLHLMEAIAPSVLWLEEVDKAFAGFADEASQDATMSRIVARFLTWLQEHEAPVFVVATANNVNRLPPELLRRGRFDELFFVDLPNFYERKAIFDIHLSKRGWRADKFNAEKLSNESEGYSGAEIEQVVNSAVIDSYSAGKILSEADLLESIERTVPLSVTMEDEVFHLREWARTRCRPATVDARVIQVLEDEERRGEVAKPASLPTPKWKLLAEFGQLGAAIVEHVRVVDHVTWNRLLDDLSPLIDLRGEFGLVLRSDPKVVVWTRISEQLADVISDLVDRRRLYLHVVDSLQNYEGAVRPTLTPLPEIPQSRVDRAMWLPTTLRLLPPKSGSGRLSQLTRIRLGRKS